MCLFTSVGAGAEFAPQFAVSNLVFTSVRETFPAIVVMSLVDAACAGGLVAARATPLLLRSSYFSFSTFRAMRS